MGEREDLKVGRQKVADLEDRWQQRRKELEAKLDESWSRLKSMQLDENGPESKNTQDVYEQITRLDRSLSFLDRALVHLDDIERGESKAKDVPLRPASTAKAHEGPERPERPEEQDTRRS